MVGTPKTLIPLRNFLITFKLKLKIHRQTFWRIKKRYLKEGLKHILEEKPRPGRPKKYDEKHNAEIIATACTSPPKGRKRWTIRILTSEINKKKWFKT